VPEILATTVSPAQRAISVLDDSGETARYALAETRDGDVFWRLDIFDGDAGGVSAGAWLRHGGRLTVGEVMASVPSCARHVATWTRHEIEMGADLPGADLFARAVRADALRRLGRELAGAVPAAA
jgi:hypothetical protein